MRKIYGHPTIYLSILLIRVLRSTIYFTYTKAATSWFEEIGRFNCAGIARSQAGEQPGENIHNHNRTIRRGKPSPQNDLRLSQSELKIILSTRRQAGETKMSSIRTVVCKKKRHACVLWKHIDKKQTSFVKQATLYRNS